MQQISDDIFRTEADEAYHARSKSGQVISSHKLAEFRKSPLLYHRHITGLIADRDSGAFIKGRAVHALALEGRQAFEDRYAFDFPVNPKTNKPYGRTTKAFEAWQEAQTKPALLPEEKDVAELLACEIRGHEEAAALISEGRPEAVVRTELCGLPCQIRIDWFNPSRGVADLKTCDDLDFFQADARKYTYGLQFAFYQLVLATAAGVKPDEIPFYVIAAEKKEPNRVAVFHIGDDTLRKWRSEVYRHLATLAECRRLNVWPSGYEQIVTLEIL
jgi:hypothetical protein